MTSLSAWHSWDVNQHYLFAASCWIVIALRLLMPGAAFFLLTYPIALIGLSCVGADFDRNVDLLELAAQWRTFSSIDVWAALTPYLLPLLAAAAMLALLGWQAARLNSTATTMATRWRLLSVATGTALLLVLAPIAVWARAWPINGLLIAAATLGNAPAVAMYSSLAVAVSPRSPSATWHASRALAPAAPETFILVIGESVRSDYFSECGGPSKVRPVAPGALVACDVTSGSDATHTTVPLLVSREMPGHGARVSDDGTFQRAFAEVGFSTHWYGVQGGSIAWPDAGVQKYPVGTDRAALLPLLDEALSGKSQRRSIVLHAYGAHEPYCSRFNSHQAPYPNECSQLGDGPTAASIGRWRAMYANAVDDSIGFMNEIIARLERDTGQVFLVFTPDHGENLLDDSRGLYAHALRHPTRWDTRVPAVFWANEAWKSAHQAQWAALARNTAAPLMHADIVPTLLAAAGIRYAEPRSAAIDLLDLTVPQRRRIVQTSIGASAEWQELVEEAR